MTLLVCTSCKREHHASFGVQVADCECGGTATTRFNQQRSELRRMSAKRERAEADLRKPAKRRKRSLRRSQPERIWDAARAKVEAEGCCRFCGESFPADMLEAAHVTGRERDGHHPVTQEPLPQPWKVEPDRIVPACGPCHREYDAHGGRGLLGRLTLAEEVQAVRDHYPVTGRGRGSGISLALRRLDPQDTEGVRAA